MPEGFPLFNDALKAFQAGDLRQTESLCRQALERQPDDAGFWDLLGAVALQAGVPNRAADLFRQAIARRPAASNYHIHLGQALRQQGHGENAATSYREALRLSPDSQYAYNCLGVVLIEQRQFEAALTCFDAAIQLAPANSETHSNRGVALFELGRYEEAAGSCGRAAELNPSAFSPHNNMGNTLTALGRLGEAESWYVRALALKPSSAESHNNLGNLFHDQGRLADAALSYESAIRLDVGFVAAHRNLGNVREEQQHLVEARKSYLTASTLERGVPLRQLRSITVCPTVFRSVQEIDRYRQQLMIDIDRFSQTDFRVDLSTLATVADAPPFNLMYQGRDDQAIKEAFAKLFRSRMPQMDPLPTIGKPRIGFVVTGGHEHAFIRCMGPVLEQLNGDFFDLAVVCLHRSVAAIQSRIRRDDLQFVAIDRRIDAAAEAIRGSRLDMLYYWEVGSDTTNYFLPHLRLAPVQCTSWGVPVTSGITTLDYYVSSELLEPAPNERPYTEQLVTLKTLPTVQPRPAAANGPRARSDFGFDNHQHVYLCVQNLAKIHPDFDAMLGGILRRDAAAVAVFIEDRERYCAARLDERLRRTIADVGPRIRFLPAQPRNAYLSLLAASNVVLDTVHYGGGLTTYDAFSQGKPVVTLPGNSQRSRFTAACYRQMGFDDCVAANAEDYVDIAYRLGTEPDCLDAVAARISQASDQLFDDTSVVRSYEDTFTTLLANVGRSN